MKTDFVFMFSDAYDFFRSYPQTDNSDDFDELFESVFGDEDGE